MIKKYLSKYVPIILIATCSILMIADYPNNTLNKQIISNSLIEVDGIGEKLSEKVFNKLESDNLVVMRQSDSNYEKRKSAYLFLILARCIYIARKELSLVREDIIDSQKLMIDLNNEK